MQDDRGPENSLVRLICAFLTTRDNHVRNLNLTLLASRHFDDCVTGGASPVEYYLGIISE